MTCCGSDPKLGMIRARSAPGATGPRLLAIRTACLSGGYVTEKKPSRQLCQPSSGLRKAGGCMLGPNCSYGRYFAGAVTRMFTIYNCIAYEHDLRLVVLAAAKLRLGPQPGRWYAHLRTVCT